MYSQLFLILASTFFVVTAVPLHLESREPHPFDNPCFPIISSPRTTAISPHGDLDKAWTIFENDDLSIKNVTLRNAHDIYEGIKYNNNFVISQTSGETINEFRFTSAVVDGIQHCIAGVSETEIRDVPCDSDLAVWNVNCVKCGENGAAQECSIRAHSSATCAEVGEDGSIGLATCRTTLEGSEDQYWDIV
ncbi:hypothetical protein JCM16303_004801 [Sporobolomyces ruberrimus]